MGKKRIYVALCLIALAMLGICFFYLKKTGWGMTGDKAWNELVNLSIMQETGVRLFLDLQAMRMMICVLRYCYMIRIIILFRCGRCIPTDSRL